MASLSALRAHQWVKNLLLFVPLLTSQTQISLSIFLLMLAGFIGFSLICSANYIINDVIDFQSDQANLYKSKKPIASGRLSKKSGIFLAIILCLIGFLLCALTSINFLKICLFYLCLGLLYSKKLKHVQHIDSVVLVLFYLIRIFAGGALFKISISFWLMLFSFTIFSTLAFVKKSSKLMINLNMESKASKNFLTLNDMNYFLYFGISFAVVSLVTFAHYLNSEEIKLLYTQPKILWLLVPLFQFLLLRIWKVTISGKMHYDPVVFILKDFPSLTCLCAMLITVVAVGRLN